MKNSRSIGLDLLLSLVIVALLGAAISAFSEGLFWKGWLGSGLLSFFCIFGLLRALRFFGGSKVLAIILIISIAVRIVVGVFLFKGLPNLGFDNPVQNAGYSYSDAFTRDQAAFQVVSDGASWLSPLQGSRTSDQYGGLLFLSSLIYRIFSPDAHRPLLMVLLSTFMMTFGLVFFYAGVKQRWGESVALAAGWVFALYPDGIMLGSSQMREPFLIGLACIAFWAVLFWRERPVRAILVSLITLGIASFISLPAGLAVLAVITGVFLIEWISQVKNPVRKKIGIALLLVFIGIVIAAGWVWLKQTLYYDAFITQTSSGWITELIAKLGTKWRIPFVTVYGLTQPLLPAALVDPSLPMWMGIAIFRALGWYFVVPFILYGFFTVLKIRKEENAPVLIWLTIAFMAWIFISSARAGGDQWDNPRYRTIFLPWMALLVGWVWQRIQNQRSAWFWRWVAVEAVFVLFFLNWYLNRQFQIGTQLPFFVMIALIGGISGVILVVGFLSDKIKTKKRIKQAEQE
jgi:hypothetical protein